MGTKITDLTALATAPDTLDVVAIVDVSDPTQAPSGTTKKITIADLGFLASGDNISLLTNDSGFITASDYSNSGEAAAGDRDLGNTNAFALSFITNGVGRLHIEAGGDVGIGTTTPSEKFEVNGNAKINGTFKTQSASPIPVNLYREGVGNNMIQLSMQNDAAAEYQFTQLGGSVIDDTTGSEEGAFLVQLSNNGAINSNGVHKFLINGLHQYPESINGGIFRESNSGGFRWSLNLRNSANAIEPYAALATEVIDNTNGSEDGVLKFYARSNGVNFNSSNHQAILTGTGFGIGTAAPTETLEVVGSIKMTDGNQALGKVITSDANGVGSWDNVVGGIFEASNNGGVVPTTYAFNIQNTLAIRGVTSVPILTCNTATGVLIGGSGVNAYNLTLETSSNTALILKRQSVDMLKVTYNASNPTLRMYNSLNGEVVNIAATAFAADHTYFNTPSNFGIGTAAPTEKLEVVGNQLINTGNLQIKQTGLGAGGLDYINLSTTGSLGVDAGQKIKFSRTSGTEHFIIRHSQVDSAHGNIIFETSTTNAQNTVEAFKIKGDTGSVGFGGVTTPTGIIELKGATENTTFEDAGSTGATEQDWVEVTVGGVTGYIRIYATK